MMKLGFSFDANSCHRAETERLIFCIGIGLFVVFIVWAFFFVPMNNDEVNHFHTLACIYNPFSHIDASQMRGCDHRYDLTTPLGFVIERPLPYIGIFASLLYAPFYFIFHSAFVQYIFGLAFFGAFSVMISRLTAKPQLTFPLLLSFLPLAFNFIHDMGPVKYAMVTFPLSVWFFHKIVRSSVPNNYIYAILLALLLFMGVEEKPFYLYLLPGLGFFILAMAGDNWVEVWGRLCKSRYALLLGGAFFIVCLIILLFSMLPNQRYYITELILMMRGVEEMPMLDPGFSWGERWMRFVFFWPNYFHRFFDLDMIDDYGHYKISWHEFIIFCLQPLVLFLCCLIATLIAWKNDQIRGVSSRSVFLVFSFIANVIVFSFFGKIWAGHHFIFIWLPLLVLFADLLARLSCRWQLLLMALFYVINLAPWLWLTHATLLDEVSRDRTAISAYFDDERALKSIVDYPSSWGYHLLEDQYGPTNQLIVRLSLKDHEIRQLYKLSQLTGRDIYIVCYKSDYAWYKVLDRYSCDKNAFEKKISKVMEVPIVFEEALPGLEAWHVFKVVRVQE